MLWQSLKCKKIAVWGMGKEGMAVCKVLQEKVPSATLVEISEDNVTDLFGCDVLIKSPGVSLYRAEIQQAKQKGIVVTSGTNLFMKNKNPNTKVIAITGTKGKSTTSSLLAHTLKNYGFQVALGGNIGVPLISLVDKQADFVVAELSSYQCADFEGEPDISVLLNLYPEHLQWHTSHQQYYADKRQMWYKGRIRIDGSNLSVQVKDGFFYDELNKLFSVSCLNLKGIHNAGNACVVLSVLKQLGLDLTKAGRAFETFQALPHRLQIIAEIDGITYVDDSISTTPETAVCAMETFKDRPVVLLVGGFDRGQDYDALNRYIQQNHIQAIAMPVTGDRIESPYHVNTVKEAVALAKQIVPKGGVVLLSPAAPSYHQYQNFEERGDDFVRAVKEA